MKQYRVRESWLVTGWTHVRAENIAEAQQLIEESKDGMENFIGEQESHQSTDWATLEECKAKQVTL